MSKQEEIKLIEEFYSLDEMFDERTLELFKIKNNIQGEEEISIDSFTSYLTGYDSCYVGLTFRRSIRGSCC